MGRPLKEIYNNYYEIIGFAPLPTVGKLYMPTGDVAMPHRYCFGAQLKTEFVRCCFAPHLVVLYGKMPKCINITFNNIKI